MAERPSRFEEIIRLAASEVPPLPRAVLLTDLLAELDGPRGIELLSQARQVISLRIQVLIEELVAGRDHNSQPTFGNAGGDE